MMSGGSASGVVGIVVVVTRRPIFSQTGGASSTIASDGTANRSWLARESIRSLLTTRKVATLALELAHADGWQLRSSVVLSLVLMDLVYGNGAVDNAWLYGLLVYDGLNILVYVVVDMLTSDG